MAIAELVLAFLFAPVGFVLSLVGLSQARKNNQGGRGIAIAGIVLSVLFTAGGVAAAVAVYNESGLADTSLSTIADPGCVSGKDVLLGLDQSPSDQEVARAPSSRARWTG